jgi:plastocyanin
MSDVILFLYFVAQLFYMKKGFQYLLVIVFGGLLITSCSKNENANSYAAGNGLPTNYISILDNGFSPNVLIVPNGSSITFLNSSNSTHTLVSDDSTTLVTTPILPTKYFSYRKYFVGILNYHCVEHPSETGIIEQTQ